MGQEGPTHLTCWRRAASTTRHPAPPHSDRARRRPAGPLVPSEMQEGRREGWPAAAVRAAIQVVCERPGCTGRGGCTASSAAAGPSDPRLDHPPSSTTPTPPSLASSSAPKVRPVVPAAAADAADGPAAGGSDAASPDSSGHQKRRGLGPRERQQNSLVCTVRLPALHSGPATAPAPLTPAALPPWPTPLRSPFADAAYRLAAEALAARPWEAALRCPPSPALSSNSTDTIDSLYRNCAGERSDSTDMIDSLYRNCGSERSDSTDVIDSLYRNCGGELELFGSPPTASPLPGYGWQLPAPLIGPVPPAPRATATAAVAAGCMPPAATPRAAAAPPAPAAAAPAGRGALAAAFQPWSRFVISVREGVVTESPELVHLLRALAR